MGLLKKFQKGGQEAAGVREFCIQTIRFEKFLENARALLDLFADGREKLAGEYIFDRHYVVSLVDGVIDRLGMMVYDAAVLAPGRGESLYAAHDRQKRFARNLIGATAPAEAVAGDDRDPEYRLLADALEWCAGDRPPSAGTVMDLMKQSFSAVLQAAAPAGTLKIGAWLERGNLKASDAAIYLVDVWKDGLSLPAGRRSAADVGSAPLRHLLVKAGAEAAVNAGQTCWVAAVDESRLSLSRLGTGPRFRLEALAGGRDASDFIFACADRSGLLENILPRGFHVETADRFWLAWNLNMSPVAIEESLAAIGGRLFDENHWRAQ